MASRVVVNEGSTSYHAITITDADGAPVTPEALRYRLMAAEGVEIIAWTALAVDATEIEVDAADNIIGETGSKRFLTLEATHNGGDKITSELEYKIVNLKGVAAPVTP
jgi:hypothetical protein